MPWREASIMSERREFVAFVAAGGVGMRELCRRFGISPTTAYKWVRRYAEKGEQGLEDESRRPRRSPWKTSEALEAKVVQVRRAQPAWGARTIRQYLRNQGLRMPGVSTVHRILQRQNLLAGKTEERPGAYRRFEAREPNELWQMDFKGHFAMKQGRCHPLDVLDDHSRFCLLLHACADEREATVHGHLELAFRRYGLPGAMLMDNGSPWGDRGHQPYTQLGVWLMRLGIRVIHGRPRHPQTQGKLERMHRTLKAEALLGRAWEGLEHCQRVFDEWRDTYNLLRPHQALELAVPASRYRASLRSFPSRLPDIEYGPDDTVRRVQQRGIIHFQGHEYRVGGAFYGMPVAVRPVQDDGLREVYFCRQRIATIDLRNPED